MDFKNVYKNIQTLHKSKINDFLPSVGFVEFEKIYFEEILMDSRPSYYEKILYIRFLGVLDSLILSRNIFNSHFIICHTDSQIAGLKNAYPNYFIISVDNIVDKIIEADKKMKEFIDVEKYYLSLFRIAYRHIYNKNKEIFLVEEDKLKSKYIVFSMNNDVTSFLKTDLFKYNKVNPIVDYVDEMLCINIIKKNSGIPYDKPLINENKILVDENMAEIELYKRFICFLDYKLLIHALINKNENMVIYKRKGDWEKDVDSIKYEKLENKYSYISIEEIIKESIKDTNLDDILDIDKYIYPCWRILNTHILNDKANFYIIKDAFKKSNPYIYMKVILEK